MEFDLSKLSEIPDPTVEATAPKLVLPSTTSATRPEVKRQRLVPAGAMVIIAILWIAGATMNSWSRWPAWFSVSAIVLPLLGGMLAAAGAMQSGRIGLGLSVTARRVLLTFTVLSFAVSAFIRPHDVGGDSAVAHMLACGGITFLLALLPFAGALFALRGTMPTRPGARGAALGLAAACYGASLIRMHCGNHESMHVLLGHGIGLLIFGIAGLFMGRHILRS